MAISDYPGDLPQLKRRQEIIGQGSAPAGIGLTPEQAKAQRDAEWRKSSIQRQQQFKQGVSDAVGTAAVSIASIPLGIGRGIANTTFDSSLPDHRSPSQKALAGEKARQYSPQQQAGGIAAYDIARRAVDDAQQPFTAGLAGDLLTVNKPAKPKSRVPAAPGQQDVAEPAVAVNKTAQGGGAGGRGEQGNDWSQTGINGIAGRMGPNGVPEYSNESSALQSVGPQRAIGRIGDGVGGGISFGEAGDSQNAIARFEHANAERAKAIEISRRGGIGEQGGLTIVGRRPMTLDDIAQAKFGLRRREQDRADRVLEQQGINAGLDRSLRERELAGTEQRTRQELEAGELSLAQQRQVAELYARYEQAAPEERAVLAEQIRTLTGKEAPNRFTVVSGGQEYDTAAGALINRPSRVLNNQTGQFVDGAGQQQGRQTPTTPQVGEQRGGYRFKGGNPADQNSWEKV
ncbi:MAG: hypothetical protein NDI93_00495 [Pseudomonas sp.]|nr:hypothetical protein [Pseudomonas sp.]